MVAEIENLAQELEKLSKVYIALEVQENVYQRILAQLREIYKSKTECFSEDTISRINKLKKGIEASTFKGIKRRIELINFYPENNICRADSYFNPQKYTPSKGVVVFHELDYFVGVIRDRNPVERVFEIRNLKNSHYWWYKPEKLLVLGYCSERIWNEHMWSDLGSTRVTHCWNCQTYLSPGKQVCRSCNWYKCTSCRSCGCGFIKAKQF